MDVANKFFVSFCAFLAAGVLACGIAKGEHEKFLHPKYIELPDKTAMQKHYLFNFEPRFKKADCLVRFDFVFEGTGEERNRAPLHVLFWQYLWRNEPKAGAFAMDAKSWVRTSVTGYIQFADECDRRFEIADAMAAFANETDPRYKVSFSRDKILPGFDTMMAEGSWIDDSSYDKELHKLWKKAVRGDGEAMFLYAEKINSMMNPMGAYQMYRRALNCLPPGPLRTKAAKKAQEALSAVPQQRKEQIENFLEAERKKSARLGIVCQP